MTYYVLKNKRNGRYISGTDFGTRRQILANENRPPKLFPKDDGIIKTEMFVRHINPKTYKVVEVEVREINNGSITDKQND